MHESRLARLAPHGRTDLLADLCHAIAEHRPEVDDPILAARHVLCRSSPDLVGLQPDGRAVYYWPNAGFASAVPFDDEDVYGGDSEIFARRDGVLDAVADREYVWMHPDYRDGVGEADRPRLHK